ncbi:MAG: GTP-binding protein, partial [Gammaproteobacteria bacterium]|nr:GTP-binding protein [Gammaproteobacteria bacterium]
TMGTATSLRDRAFEHYGVKPAVLLVNKHDLTGAWDVSEQRLKGLQAQFGSVFVTSAKTGAHVDDALTHLAELIVDRAIADQQ